MERFIKVPFLPVFNLSLVFRNMILCGLLECCRENLASDCFQGCFVVTCTLCAFISLVWLREQILHGGGPDWLEQDNQQANHGRVGHVCLWVFGAMGFYV